MTYILQSLFWSSCGHVIKRKKMRKKKTVKRLLLLFRKERVESWVRKLVVEVWEIIRFWMRFLKHHNILAYDRK